MKVEIINGKVIPFEKMMAIKQIRADAFNEGIIKEEKKIPFDDEILFIIHDKSGKILAVGCLYQIKAKLLGKAYSIQGIGSITAVEKGKGYGKMLMQEIHDYLKKHELTGLGFCSPINTPFYKKCNFLILNNCIQRFVNTSGIGRQPPTDEDILYINGKNEFMKEFLSHPKAKIHIPHFW